MNKDTEAVTEPIPPRDGNPDNTAQVQGSIAGASATKDTPDSGNDSSEHEIVLPGSSSSRAQVLLKKEDTLLTSDDFHANDNRILALFTDEKGSKYSFKGLMRKLNIHQQSLARALHRLEYLGLVEKSAAGYALAKNGESMLAQNNIRPADAKSGKAPTPYMQILQTFVPINMRAHEIAYSLAGKWFKNLRWLGIIESETGCTLQWASNSNDGSCQFQINLKIISDFIVIEANPSSDKEKVQAMVGSYAIYEQITKIFQDKFSYNDASVYVFTDRYYPNRNN